MPMPLMRVIESDRREFGWVVGFLEGEGCFQFGSRSLHVSAGQRQQQPLIRLQSLLGGSIKPIKRYKPEHKCKLWYISGENALALMYALYQFMSPRRQWQIRKAIKRWRSIGIAPKYKTKCVHGHLRIPENQYVYTIQNKITGKTRQMHQCKICALIQSQNRRNAKKLYAAA